MPSSTHSSRVAELQTQLEYSAFMTKGVLQTNTELRLQIAELEQQNAALHVAESRLSDVEDQLEEVENRLREKEAELLEWKKQKSDHRKELRVEVQARKAAERERDEWKEMLTTFKEFLEDGKSGFARWSEVFRDLEKERNQADAELRQASSSKNQIHTPITVPRPRSPVHTAVRKRRRVISSPPDDRFNLEETTQPPVTLPRTTARAKNKGPEITLSDPRPTSDFRHSERRHRDRTPKNYAESPPRPSPRKPRRSASHTRKAVSEEFVIKIKSETPDIPTDTEDDPLAMSD